MRNSISLCKYRENTEILSGERRYVMREQLRKALDQVSLVPARDCSQDQVTILLGAIGLDLYAAYSKLIQMEMEFRHAPEYLEKDLQKDVEETMEINGEIFTAMEGKCRKRREELLKFKKGDEAFCEPIGDLLEQFAEELKELAGYRLGSDALKDVNEYLERLRGILEALREYLGLCIGSSMVWEREGTGFSEI